MEIENNEPILVKPHKLMKKDVINLEKAKLIEVFAITYMGGLALMVISPKNWGSYRFFTSILGIIQPHLKFFCES